MKDWQSLFDLSENLVHLQQSQRNQDKCCWQSSDLLRLDARELLLSGKEHSQLKQEDLHQVEQVQSKVKENLWMICLKATRRTLKKIEKNGRKIQAYRNY